MPNHYEAFCSPSQRIHRLKDGTEYIIGYVAIIDRNGTHKIISIRLLLKGGACRVPCCPDFPKGAFFTSVKEFESALGVSYIPTIDPEKKASLRDKHSTAHTPPSLESQTPVDISAFSNFFLRDDISAYPSGDEQRADRYRDEEPNRYEIFFGNNGKIQHSRDGTECVTGTLVITGLNEDRNYRTLRFLLPVEDATCFIVPCNQFPKGKSFNSVEELEEQLGVSYISKDSTASAEKRGWLGRVNPLLPPDSTFVETDYLTSPGQEEPETTQNPPRKRQRTIVDPMFKSPASIEDARQRVALSDDLFSDSLAKRIRQLPAKPEISSAERQGLDELEPLPEDFDHLPEF